MISAFALFLAAATAQPVAGSADTDATQKNPDPIICQRVSEIGSLLRSKKVCMTKSQWADQRRSDRDSVEHSQVQRGMQAP